MDTKTLGAIYGSAILVLWFMPFGTATFMGFEISQSGQSMGGIAYLLLLAGGVVAITSWVGQHQLCMIAAGAGLVVGLLLALGFGLSTGWGLIGIISCFTGIGIRTYKASKLVKLG